ncbi:hypothetical protein A4X13_0g7399 [Tilletia indica]|uniref:Tyr recombinase domain-containing protein n=1 Tax=Tilletia indica TaxID=43049 RepID=A0A177TA07_9BASI|nr:hypothetical protein A4X13_0g7399 [Tilletia indica]
MAPTSLPRSNVRPLPFALWQQKGLVHELRTQFCVDTANAALTAAGRTPITAHCLRIGGTTFYLAAGIPEADIRRHGRWKSDAMLVYLRRLYVAAGRTFANVDPTHG